MRGGPVATCGRPERLTRQAGGHPNRRAAGATTKEVSPMSAFFIVCCVAIVLGVCNYLTRVRPAVRSFERSLDEAHEIETWWHLDASIVDAAGQDTELSRTDAA
jgi:hypothetical protein